MSEAVARAGVVNLLGGACGSAVGLLLAALVGRTLGTEGAGTYFVAVAVFLIASNVLELGADTGLVRFVSAAVATGRTATVRALVVGAVRPVLVVGAVFVGLVAVGAASGVNPTDFSGWQLTGGAAIAVASSGVASALSLTRGLGDPVTYPLLQNVTLPLLRLTAVALVVGLIGASATDVVVAWMLPTVVVAVLAGLAARRALRYRTAGLGREPADVRAFWAFSASRGVAAAIEIALEWIDVLIVAALASAEAAGVYAVVTRAARAGEVVQQAARIAVGPQISAALARNDVLRARQLYGLVTAAMIWVAWPFYVVVAVFAEAVLDLFGPGFDAGATSLRILVAAMAVATAAGTVQTIVLMGGRSRWQLADKAGALVLNVVLTVALVPAWGIEGAAVAWAVTIVVDTAVVVWQVQGLMGVRPIGTYPLVAAAVSMVGVGGACLVGRAWFGSSLTVLLCTTAVAAAGYLVMSAVLRDRLGLTRLSE
ncbi:oligosaccharide flippase family protein [Aeromicrobium sp. CF3.5]|uniref:oligosaccharide flippase family protein n=1 Tax=Aeromicrobium sp. CF3.5 TaxID=3373078 RepID=UPI003EE576C6